MMVSVEAITRQEALPVLSRGTRRWRRLVAGKQYPLWENESSSSLVFNQMAAAGA